MITGALKILDLKHWRKSLVVFTERTILTAVALSANQPVEIMRNQ